MNTLLENPLVARLGWTLLHFLWQGAAVAAVFAIVNGLTRNAPAQRRYATAYGFLILMAICPLVTFTLLKSPSPSVASAPVAGASQNARPPTANAPELATGEDGDFRIPDKLADSEPAYAAAPDEPHDDWPSKIVVAWLAGVAAFSLRHAGGWLRLRRYRRDARRIKDPAILRVLAELRDRLGLNRAVELLESAQISVPATIGLLKPVILIPVSALTGLERWQLEAIVAHELAHVRRWDFAANLIQCAIETVLFYHPAVWWISHVVRQEREYCADDVALAICGNRKGYAVALTRLAELALPAELAVAATGGNLLSRIRRIMERPTPQRSGTASVIAALVVTGVVAAVLMGSRVLAEDTNIVEVKAGESIQAAVEKAPDDAVIRIAAGEYRERIRIGKPLTLEGAGWDKTRVALPPDNEKKRAEFEEKIQGAKTADEREQLIEASRAALDGPVLSVSDTRDVTIRGLRVEAGVKENNRQLPPLAEFRNAKLLVTKCAFTGPAQDGIHIGDNAEVELAECLVAGLWSEGIVINGARGADPRAVIRDSEVRNIYHYGIQIGRGCDRVQILRCRISGTAWHGIRYDSASPLIEGNTIYDHARSGIYASGRTRATIRENLFFRNEMSGISCWYDNQDLIERNTFAANQREGIAVLGTSKPKIRANILWANPTAISEGRINNDELNAKGAAILEGNFFWKNKKNRESEDNVIVDTQKTGWNSDILLGSKSQLSDPGFIDTDKLNFALLADSAARKAGVGAADPLAVQSPWPILDEEKQLIPDGPSRDSNAWKKADGSVQAPANRYQRQHQLYRSVEPIVKDALQIDDTDKRTAAVEKIRAKIMDKSDKEAAAGLVAYQSIGTVKFDKKSFHDALISKLDSKDPFVRSQAIQSLSGGAGDRKDLEQLMRLSTDPDTSVRSAVGWALVWLTNKDLTGPEGAKWVEIFEAGNAAFRKELVHGLWGVKTTVSLQERLATLSREQGELAYDCLYYALSTSPNKGEACVTRLIEYLANADTTNIAGRAAWGLTYGVEPDQKDRVAEAMLKVCEAREDGYMRRNALDCLAQYAREKHVAALEGFLAKPGLSDDDRKKIEGIVASAKQRK